MAKITITLPDNIHHILKELAKQDRRSLSNYIICKLEDIASKRYVSTQPKFNRNDYCTKQTANYVYHKRKEKYRRRGIKTQT